MIDLKLLRETPDVVKAALDARGIEADVDGLLGLDAQRRDLIFKADELKRKRNEVSEAISKRYTNQQTAC